jgi:hypothetical protein
MIDLCFVSVVYRLFLILSYHRSLFTNFQDKVERRIVRVLEKRGDELRDLG